MHVPTKILSGATCHVSHEEITDTRVSAELGSMIVNCCHFEQDATSPRREVKRARVWKGAFGMIQKNFISRLSDERADWGEEFNTTSNGTRIRLKSSRYLEKQRSYS